MLQEVKWSEKKQGGSTTSSQAPRQLLVNLVIIAANSFQGGPISLRIVVHDGDDTELWNYIDGKCICSKSQGTSRPFFHINFGQILFSLCSLLVTVIALLFHYRRTSGLYTSVCRMSMLNIHSFLFIFEVKTLSKFFFFSENTFLKRVITRIHQTTDL